MSPYQGFAAARIVLLVLLAAIFLALGGRRPPSRALRALVAAVVVAAVASYPNFGFFHPPRGSPIHDWDAFHYFMGAKYLPELGYTGLYEATLVAGRELGAFDYVTHVRDLTTYALRDARTIDGRAVRGRFTDERWKAFKSDLLFLGPRIDVWRGLFLDHGYNDPPPRAFLLHLAVRWMPAGPVALALLTSLDYLLVAAAFGLAWRTWGTLPAALALALFSLSFFARFDFIGGSILRWDWIAALLAGVAALARGAGVTAGLLLGYAVLARLFPLLLLVPLGVKWLQARLGRAPDAVLGRCLGSVAAIVLLAGAGLLSLDGGRGLLGEFLAKMRLHADAPFVNHIGLGSLIVFGSAPWSQDAQGALYVSQAAALAARPDPLVLLLATVLCLLVLLPLVLRARAPESFAYGAPLIFCALSPAGYYYSFLVLLVLLPWSRPGPDRPRSLQAALLALVMAASYASEVAAEPLFLVTYRASALLGGFLLAWVSIEYLRLGAPGPRLAAGARAPGRPEGRPARDG